MVVMSRCFAFHMLIMQVRILKSFWVENSTILLYLPIPSTSETIYKQAVSIFFVYKTLWLVRISLLISAITKSFAFFLGKFNLKSKRKLLSCICIAWYKHSRGWENSWHLCKLETSRILPARLVFISGYVNVENVFYCLNLNLHPSMY